MKNSNTQLQNLLALRNDLVATYDAHPEGCAINYTHLRDLDQIIQSLKPLLQQTYTCLYSFEVKMADYEITQTKIAFAENLVSNDVEGITKELKARGIMNADVYSCSIKESEFSKSKINSLMNEDAPGFNSSLYPNKIK